MKKEKPFNNRTELLEEFKDNCKNYKELASFPDFSDFETFKKFFELYYPKDKIKGRQLSAFSERFFMLFLADLFKKWDKIKYQRKLTLEKLSENGDDTYKFVDMAIIINSKEFLIDFKMNIDLVEKDLFKGYLIKRKKLEGSKKKLKYFLIIFEKKDDSKNKNTRDSQSLQLLKHGKKEGLISDYFYFPCKNESSYMEKEFDKTKEKLIKSFSRWIARL